jgi:hypothetical protein
MSQTGSRTSTYAAVGIQEDGVVHSVEEPQWVGRCCYPVHGGIDICMIARLGGGEMEGGSANACGAGAVCHAREDYERPNSTDRHIHTIYDSTVVVCIATLSAEILRGLVPELRISAMCLLGSSHFDREV